MPRPLHMLVEIPPKYSVFSFMGYFKEKSGLTIYEKYPKVSINIVTGSSGAEGTTSTQRAKKQRK